MCKMAYFVCPSFGWKMRNEIYPKALSVLVQKSIQKGFNEFEVTQKKKYIRFKNGIAN